MELVQGSHGFVTTHKWRDTVGAFINIEASGSGGPGKILFGAKYHLLLTLVLV